MNLPKTVLILENHRHTLPVARSLAAAGVSVIAGVRRGRRDDTFIRHSRAVSEIWTHPDFGEQDGEDFLRALEQRLTQGNVEALFPVGEDSLRLLCRAALERRMPSGTLLVAAAPEVTVRCLDKVASLTWAREAAIPLPRSEEVTSDSTLYEAVSKVGFPCAIKPTNSRLSIHGRKCLLVDSQLDLNRLMPCWPEGHSQLLVQGRAAGFRHNCIFIASGGKSIRYFESRVLRTDSADGTGYGVEVISVEPSAKRREHCDRAIRAIGYAGVGCIQFMVDPTHDTEIFLELNPRIDATVALPVALGMDFPRWALESAMGSPLSGNDGNGYRVGSRCAWTLGDFSGWIQSPVESGASRPWAIFLATLRSRYHATFKWSDPIPTAYLYFQKMMSIGLRLTGIRLLLSKIR